MLLSVSGLKNVNQVLIIRKSMQLANFELKCHCLLFPPVECSQTLQAVKYSADHKPTICRWWWPAYSGFVNISRPAEYFAACYTVLNRPNKVEIAVRGCNLALSLDSIVSLPRYAYINVKPEGGGGKTPGICGAFDLYCLPQPRQFD